MKPPVCVRATHPTLDPFGQLSGKQHVGELALSVSSDRVVTPLPVQVIELDLAHGVSQRRDVDDSGWSRVLQQVQQQESQKERT